MIRIRLPFHLRTLAHIDGDVQLGPEPAPTAAKRLIVLAASPAAVAT
jgi:hypothetical protein